MAINANANGIPFLKRYGIPPTIKKSMVLWYDIARQGATNELMAENSILKDLSGNGHDATCHNFDWSGMSGIGGYAISNIKSVIRPNNSTQTFVTYDNNIITCLNLTGNTTSIDSVILYSRIINFDSRTIKFNGGNYGLIVKQTGEVGGNRVVIANIAPGEDSIVTVDEDLYNNGKNLLMFGPNTIVPANTSWYFEQLPLYPNALVSDGVDDIAQSDIFNIGKDWTLMFDADFFSEKNISAGIVKSSRVYVYDFGGNNELVIYINETDVRTATIDKENVPYCILSDDRIYLKDGTIIITESSQNVANNISLSAFDIFGHGNKFVKIALRKVMLFNRVLTDEEIEWVKTNLIPISTNE